MIELLKDTRIDNILLEKQENNKERSKVGYNIFTLSSYNNHSESFHSDVFASFLDTKGLHGEGRLFLDEFLKYLNNNCKLTIDLNNFQEPIVLREQGRIDILIIDKSKKNAIIFENKINDAPDMDDQLIRYFNWCKKNHLNTVAILYVSLRGLKKAPPVSNDIKDLVRNIAVFSDSESDIVNGWLLKCLNEIKSIETKSLLIQYIELLKFLTFDSMDKKIIDDFYKEVNSKNDLEKINNLKKFAAQIPIYRTDKFQDAIEDFSPFKKSSRYKPNYVLFDYFKEGDNSFKLDVSFSDDGSAWIGFWNPPKHKKNGNIDLINKVKQISKKIELVPNENKSWFSKTFILDDKNNMEQIDKEVISFVKSLMIELKKTKK